MDLTIKPIANIILTRSFEDTEVRQTANDQKQLPRILDFIKSFPAALECPYF